MFWELRVEGMDIFHSLSHPTLSIIWFLQTWIFMSFNHGVDLPPPPQKKFHKFPSLIPRHHIRNFWTLLGKARQRIRNFNVLEMAEGKFDIKLASKDGNSAVCSSQTKWVLDWSNFCCTSKASNRFASLSHGNQQRTNHILLFHFTENNACLHNVYKKMKKCLNYDYKLHATWILSWSLHGGNFFMRFWKTISDMKTFLNVWRGLEMPSFFESFLMKIFHNLRKVATVELETKNWLENGRLKILNSTAFRFSYFLESKICSVLFVAVSQFVF